MGSEWDEVICTLLQRNDQVSFAQGDGEIELLRLMFFRLLAIPIGVVVFLNSIVLVLIGIGFEIVIAIRRLAGAVLWCFRRECSSCQSDLAESRLQMSDLPWLLVLLTPRRCTMCMQRQRRVLGR